MIIFCILGFSIIFIALIIWIFGREEEDFKIDGIFDRKEDKEEEFYRRLEDNHDIDTGFYEVKPRHYKWVYNPKQKEDTTVNYRLSPVRSNYREPKEEETVKDEKPVKKVDCSRYIIPEYWKKKDKFGKENNKVDNGYNAILDSPEWKACREWVFSNKGRYCAYCKRNWDLRIHHKYYLKYPDGEHIKPWEYNIDCYMVLCDDCHKKVHEEYQIKTYYIRRG